MLGARVKESPDWFWDDVSEDAVEWVLTDRLGAKKKSRAKGVYQISADSWLAAVYEHTGPISCYEWWWDVIAYLIREVDLCFTIGVGTNMDRVILSGRFYNFQRHHDWERVITSIDAFVRDEAKFLEDTKGILNTPARKLWKAEHLRRLKESSSQSN